MEDAEFFQEDLNVNWPIGIDTNEDDQIFRSLCKTDSTPCVIIYDPSTKIMTKFLGKSDIADWEKESGTWQF